MRQNIYCIIIKNGGMIAIKLFHFSLEKSLFIKLSFSKSEREMIFFNPHYVTLLYFMEYKPLN